MTYEDTTSATSSLALEDGATRSDWPVGTTAGPSGPEALPARTSASPRLPGGAAAECREIVLHWLSSGSISSEQFDLAMSCSRTCRVSRRGLPKSRDVWRALATAFPDVNCRLRMLVALIYAGECGLLPTVTARDGKNPGRADHERLSASRGEPLPETFGLPLPAALAGWMMGFPDEWMQCAPSETRSTRSQQARSSSRSIGHERP